MIRILIAEDHPIVAEGILNVLRQNPEWQIIGPAYTISDCKRLLQEQQPDVLVLDIGMPEKDSEPNSPLKGTNTLDNLVVWKRMIPQLRILMLSFYSEPAVVRRALELGADGYVLKDSSTKCIMEGVKAIVIGATYLCPRARQALNQTSDTKPEPLTPREREVLALIVEGLPVKQIADRLCLSFETVHSYTKFLRAKLGVNNTAALVRKALEQRLV